MKRTGRFVINLAIAATAIAAFVFAGPPGPTQQTQAAPTSPQVKLPLSFVANAGQADKRVRFSAQTRGAGFYFLRDEAVIALSKKTKTETKKALLRLAFLGANPHPAITGAAPQAGKVNYLVGRDRTRWRTGLPTFGAVVYRDLWPGVDLRFRSGSGQLKYDFLVRPGARPADIRLAYRGARRVSLDPAGNLRLATGTGSITDTRPVSYQLDGGKRTRVASRFTLAGRGAYGFDLGGYDPSRPLVIDPGLVYSTFLGGSDEDAASGIAVDLKGNAYVTGLTASANFPTTAGAYDTSYNGGVDFYGRGDVFVTKLNATGTARVYSTYIGGTLDEPYFGGSIAIDQSGNAYITGTTWSSDYPTTPGAFDTTFNGPGYDGFVTKLNRDGSNLVYSTFLGGNEYDGGYLISGIAVDPNGKAYVTGFTDSPDFPTTPGAYDRIYNTTGLPDPFAWDAFVTKFNSSGSALVYSTYLGGDVDDDGTSIAIDSRGQAYVTGYTQSPNYPTTLGAYQQNNNGYYDAFVTKLNSSGSGLVYSTYLGGAGYDSTIGIKIDSAGSAYLAGGTGSPDFDTTPGAYDTTLGGPFDGFVTKLSSSGSSLAYSTFLGGTLDDGTYAIALDGSGQAHVSGYTNSPDYPVTPDAYQPTQQGGYDAFVAKLNGNGSSLAYSTYLGGTLDDQGLSIALDWGGKVYVAGYTISPNYPVTPHAAQPLYGGGVFYGDAFVTKLDIGGRSSGNCDRNDDSDRAERDELDHINKQRSASLLPALTLNAASSNSARKHSCDQEHRGETGERDDDGKMSADRMRVAGVPFLVNAETDSAAVGETGADAFSALDSNLADDALAKANALNPAFKQVGIGAVYVDGVMVMTVDYTG